MRDVQKGATLLTGEAGGVPLPIFIPFPKRKGNKGMVGTLIKTLEGPNTNFLYKAPPTLYLPFTVESFTVECRIICIFVVDQLVEVVTFGKTFYKFFLVFPNSFV